MTNVRTTDRDVIAAVEAIVQHLTKHPNHRLRCLPEPHVGYAFAIVQMADDHDCTETTVSAGMSSDWREALIYTPRMLPGAR